MGSVYKQSTHQQRSRARRQRGEYRLDHIDGIARLEETQERVGVPSSVAIQVIQSKTATAPAGKKVLVAEHVGVRGGRTRGERNLLEEGTRFYIV